MKKKVQRALIAALVTLGVIGTLVVLNPASASAATCAFPTQHAGQHMSTTTEVAGGVTVFDSPHYTASEGAMGTGDCQETYVAYVEGVGTANVQLRVATKPAGGTHFNGYGVWVTVPTDQHAWNIITPNGQDPWDQFEVQQRVVSGQDHISYIDIAG